MVRTAIAILAGAIVGVVVIFIVEGIGHLIYPPPEGVDLKDPAAVAGIMSEIPVGAKAAVLVAWGLGVFVGGIVSRLIARQVVYAQWVVAVLLFAGAAYTMVIIPHPIWMAVGAVVITILGASGATGLMRIKK